MRNLFKNFDDLVEILDYLFFLWLMIIVYIDVSDDVLVKCFSEICCFYFFVKFNKLFLEVIKVEFVLFVFIVECVDLYLDIDKFIIY